jgi:hypothetical protein
MTGQALTRKPNDGREFNLPKLHPSILNRPWDGFLFIYKLGDVNQLPPVLIKPVYDTRSGKAESLSQCSCVSLEKIIDPSDETQAQSTVVIMECVLLQNDQQFKDLIDHVRNSTLVRADHNIKFIFNKMLYNLPNYDQVIFCHAIHPVPRRNMGDRVLYNYLQNVMTEPLAFVYTNYHTTKSSGLNCLMAESSWPKKQAFYIDARVMLLHNFHVDSGFINGAIGIIPDIHYTDPWQ